MFFKICNNLIKLNNLFLILLILDIYFYITKIDAFLTIII